MRSKGPRKTDMILPVEEFEFGKMEATARKQVKAGAEVFDGRDRARDDLKVLI